MDEASEKKLRSLKLKLVMAEKELQAAGAKWKLGGFLGAGHANAMNREVEKVKSRLNDKIEKVKQQIAELTGEMPPAKSPAKKTESDSATIKTESKKAAEKPVAKKTPDKKTAAKTEPKKTEKASAKKPLKKK